MTKHTLQEIRTTLMFKLCTTLLQWVTKNDNTFFSSLLLRESFGS